MIIAASHLTSHPKLTAAVKFWVLALSGFMAAASWWKGFHSAVLRYLGR